MDSSANAASYTNAFPTPATGMGCPAAGCSGYELRQSLDFDTDGDGDVDADDPNSYANFGTIGGTFAATFRGNGHTISNLTIAEYDNVGMFAEVSASATIRGVGLISPNVTGLGSGSTWAFGALAGRNAGTIIGSYAIGGTVATAQQDKWTGGLVGTNSGLIRTSYSTNTVNDTSSGAGSSDPVGGLVGTTAGGTIRNSYAAGSVSGSGSSRGGLAGTAFNGTVATSYWDNTIVNAAGFSVSASLGKTTSELQTPTTYDGIYSTWDDTDGDAWNFGTSTEYPVLKFDGLDPAVQRPGMQTVGTPPPPPPNAAPVAVGAFEDLDLDPGGRMEVSLLGKFRDPEGGALTYSAESLNPEVATAAVSNGRLWVTGGSAGLATVQVKATDSGGQSAQLAFQVTVGRVLTFPEAAAAAAVP